MKLQLVESCIMRRVGLVGTQESKGRVMAIRREDQSVWERRAPLSPSNVRRLTRAGVKVIVQSSNRRAYPLQVRRSYRIISLFINSRIYYSFIYFYGPFYNYFVIHVFTFFF